MNQVPIKDNKVIIRIKDGQLSFNTTDPMPYEDLLSTFCTVMLGVMREMVASAPEEIQPEMRGALYDAFNVMASKTLEKFAPELELRPNLTTMAILKAENEIIMNGGLKYAEPHT